MVKRQAWCPLLTQRSVRIPWQPLDTGEVVSWGQRPLLCRGCGQDSRAEQSHCLPICLGISVDDFLEAQARS